MIEVSVWWKGKGKRKGRRKGKEGGRFGGVGWWVTGMRAEVGPGLGGFDLRSVELVVFCQHLQHILRHTILLISREFRKIDCLPSYIFDQFVQ